MNLKILIGFGVLGILWWMNPSVNSTTRLMYHLVAGDVPALIPILYIAAHLALLLAFVAYTFKLAIVALRSGLPGVPATPSKQARQRQHRVLVNARLANSPPEQVDPA